MVETRGHFEGGCVNQVPSVCDFSRCVLSVFRHLNVSEHHSRLPAT